MNRLRNLFFAAAVLLAAGCRDGDRVTAPRGQALPASELRLDVADDTAGPALADPARPTAFLEPLAASSASAGAFDPDLQPVVEVCPAADADCAAPVARFTTSSGAGSETVRADAGAGHYIVNWHTGASALANGASYRVRVVVGGTETASRAVTVVASGGDARNVADGSFALVNGRTLPIKFRIAKVRRLSVLADAGAAGTPADQDSMYAFGAQVAYSYQAAPGYHALQVTVDGQPAPASGTLAMDRDHVVTATAEGDVTLPAGAEPLLESSRAILTSADRPAAFQHHLDLVVGVYAEMGIEAAKAHMDSVYAVAFDVVRDSAAMREAEEALANHTFSVQQEPGAATAVRRASGPRLALAGQAGPHVTFYTVNGIFTNPAGAADNMGAALKAAQDAHVTGPDDDFRLFYNSSFLHSNQVGLAIHRCFEKALSDHRLLGYVLLIPRLGLCVAEASLRAILSFDLFEAARQVLNVTGTFPIGAVHDAQVFADEIRTRTQAGENLVVIPHSQGNLLTQEALKVNRESAPETQNRLCIGVVSAAAPVSGHFLLRPNLEKGLYVRNDLILMLPFTQGYPQVETDKSRDAERTWGRWYWRLLGLRTPVMLFERFKLHSFADSYLGARQSRDVITAGMAAERTTLLAMPECAPARVASVQVSPASASLSVGQVLPVSAVAKDSAGNVLTGRAVTWSTSDATVARLFRVPLGPENVIAVGQGTATITATVEGVSGTATVSVAATVASVSVVPSAVTLQVGEVRDLDAVARDAAGNVVTGRSVLWISQDPSVATITPTGAVTAVAEGTARITAAVDGVEGAATVTVAPSTPTAPPSDTIPVGAASTRQVNVPASGHTTLSFDARIDWPSTAGNSTILEITVNGTPVTSAALVNKPASYTYVNRGGTEPYYQNRGSSFGQAAPYWGLFWSPNYSQNNDSSDFYYVAGGQPYTFVLNLDGLVTPGQANNITFRNHAEWLRDLTGLTPVIVLHGVTVSTQ
jgi:uncharacterized protein YjdB